MEKYMRTLTGFFFSICFMMVQAAPIDFSPAWSRTSVARLGSVSVFLNITNNTGKDDILVSATTPRASKVLLRETVDVNGVMRMRKLKTGIALPQGQTIELKPGGLHLMLIGIDRRLRLNEQFDLTLNFGSGTTRTIKVHVNNGEGMINSGAADILNPP